MLYEKTTWILKYFQSKKKRQILCYRIQGMTKSPKIMMMTSEYSITLLIQKFESI